ncbi:hypothetical protein OCH239_12705 [Roseivivax halodurans JCM 10272]|uniref:Uncharacterized protein n=1 Tax=Roseivivax halodurans JCM 10272 TaxID=1449350 RepID=X7EB97_9RHOB|nr:hypothetical protein [Roseivivax halodurans]ETX13232.1 hypothetical protein OCH239_12705 [Roseivivax halodurans JCM 10272]
MEQIEVALLCIDPDDRDTLPQSVQDPADLRASPSLSGRVGVPAPVEGRAGDMP